jgi:membrane protein DedA with SNARE-associated domain
MLDPRGDWLPTLSSKVRGSGGQVKELGYLLSITSVLLIGYAAADSLWQKPVLLMSLLSGIVLSIVGMALRWLDHKRDQSRPRL